MKRNRIIGLSIFALSLLVIDVSPAFARHPCWDIDAWQQGDSTLTKEQQASAKKIYAEYASPIQTMRQQILSKRHEYRALLTSQSPDKAKIEELAKEISTLNQSLDELLVKRDVALVQAGVPHGPGTGHGDGRGPGYHRGNGPLSVDY